MKISIAMTTYNGEKYIIDQLESFLRQTRLPDEVIICDDCSSDNTIVLIRDFINKNSLINWTLVLNKRNKGWQKNFIDAIAMTTGDIIFCSDQDDIWLENKIEVMVQAMEQNTKIMCLSGKIITIDWDGYEFKSKSLIPRGRSSGAISKVPFSKKFNNITLLGCTMCFTRELALAVVELNIGNFGHDAQISRLSTILNGTYIIDLPVIKYRIHQNNTSGIMTDVCCGSSSKLKRIERLKTNTIWLNAVIDYCTRCAGCSMDTITILQETRDFLSNRLKFFETKSIIRYIGLLNSFKYYSNVGMYLGDICYCFGVNKVGGKLMWLFRSAFGCKSP